MEHGYQNLLATRYSLPTTFRVSVNLHHTDLGGAGKPPMIVLHGMLGSSRNWLSTGRDLAKHFHVFAVDARNHGKSPHAPEMSYEVMVDDLVRWMDAQGLPKAVITGHSMGGKTAMLLACRHPERVERLVVVDIAPKDYYWVAHRAEFLAMAEHRQGHIEQARDWLEKANAGADKALGNQAPGAEVVWNRRLTLSLLREEVEQLIGKPTN